MKKFRKILLLTTEKNFKRVKDMIVERGFFPLNFPVIEIKKVDYKIPSIKFDWIIFTSRNSVEFFLEKVDRSYFKNVKVGVIGGKTAELLKKKNIGIDFIPSKFDSINFIKEFGLKYKINNLKILIPQSDIGGNRMKNFFEEKGGLVKVIVIYKNSIPENLSLELLSELLKSEEKIYILFSSPSTVRNILKVKSGKKLLENSFKIAIGQITSQYMKSIGINVDFMPQISTFEDSIRELENLLNNR